MLFDDLLSLHLVTFLMFFILEIIMQPQKNPKTTKYISSNYYFVIWKLIITSGYPGCMGPLSCPVSFDALEDPDTKM